MSHNFTLLIQGKILKSTYDFYLKNYKQNNIIVSTWEDCKLEFDDSIIVIKSPYPTEHGTAHRNLHFYSTMVGLQTVSTEFVIKLRGDEEYSNLDHAMELSLKNDDKILTSPLFFRRWNYIPYHMSDHLMVGKTENLLTMFEASYNGIVKNCNGFYTKAAPEAVLGKSYLKTKVSIKLDESVSCAQYMKQYFDVLNLTNYKPYKVVANCLKRVWRNNFIPSEHESISNINQIV